MSRSIDKYKNTIDQVIDPTTEPLCENNEGQPYARNGADRRGSYLKSLLYSSFKRQRKGQRRLQDNLENTFTDVHETKLAFVLSITLLLCVMDAFLTLSIIERGGREVNPFMLFLMTQNIDIFFWVKFFMTALGMLFLISHKHFTLFRVINGYHLFYGVAVMYFVLVNYEIFLLMKMSQV